MTAATNGLPTGWPTMLDEVQRHLDQSIASADAHLASIPVLEPVSAAHDRLRELADWSERLRRLSAYLESAEQTVQSVDETLQAEETRIRQMQAACGALQRRLADGTARA